MMYKSLSLFLLSLPMLQQGCAAGVKDAKSSTKSSKDKAESTTTPATGEESTTTTTTQSTTTTTTQSTTTTTTQSTTTTTTGENVICTYSFGDETHELHSNHGLYVFQGTCNVDITPWAQHDDPMELRDADWFARCNSDGTAQDTKCFERCEHRNSGFTINPVHWEGKIDQSAYRDEMERICRNDFGFQNGQVLDSTVANELFYCHSTWSLGFDEWFVRQCKPDMHILDQITQANYEELIRDPEVYQAMDGYCLSQHGKTVGPVMQTVELFELTAFLDAQCIKKQYTTWLVPIMAEKDGNLVEMKVHFDYENYSSVRNVHGVPENFCNHGKLMALKDESNTGSTTFIKNIFLNADSLDDLHFSLCKTQFEWDHFDPSI